MTITEAPVFEDSTPPVDEPEFACEKCGHALIYSGRGRKPRVCSDKNSGDPQCYGSSSRSTGGKPRTGASNDKLARQATDVLVTLNGMLATGSFVVGWTGTAGAIARANESFEAAAFDALLLDPALCRMILRGGSNSGKLALTLAYGMFAASIAPAAISDVKMWQADRAKTRAEKMYGDG